MTGLVLIPPAVMSGWRAHVASRPPSRLFVAATSRSSPRDGCARPAGPRHGLRRWSRFVPVQTPRLGGGLAVWQLPARPREVAVVAARVALEVVLVLGLGLPERDGLADLGHDLAGPQARGLDVGDRVLGDLALLVARVEDLGPVGRADVVALAVTGRRVVDLEEELEDVPVGDPLRVEDDLDRLGVTGVVPVGRVVVLAARVADPGGDDAVAPAQQLLDAPEAASREDRRLSGLAHRLSFVTGSGPYLIMRRRATGPAPELSDAGLSPGAAPPAGAASRAGPR